MTTSLVSAFSTIMSLKRWNLLPQVEIWLESENIAYYTHMAFAIGKNKLNNKQLEVLLIRCLLKSFNKYLLSDILVESRDKIKVIDKDLWTHLVDEIAKPTSELFPRLVSKKFFGYLTFNGSYEMQDEKIKLFIEELISYCQYKVALEELSINMKVFESSKYKQIKENIVEKINNISKENLDFFNEYETTFAKYFVVIRRLKNLRRWNRTNRSVESTVMGHTFMVSVLVIVFSTLATLQEKHILVDDFRYNAILRALFHDVPESLTGDVITPVKNILEKKRPGVWRDVEKLLVKEFIDELPGEIKEEVENKHLLSGFNDDLYSVDSIVKACDQLALIMECLFERQGGSTINEMEAAYNIYISKLQNSEWSGMREYAHALLFDFPK